MSNKKVVAIVSGGLDSTTMMYDLVENGWKVTAVSFDYGQRHRREIVFAAMAAERLQVPHHLINLTSLKGLLSNSALTDDTVSVPEGHYAADNMKQTIVPNRNMMMLSIAAAVAVGQEAEAIATAVHAGDHFVYPDCRPTFVQYCEKVIRLATGLDLFRIMAPYINKDKSYIARKAFQLRVPLHLTWSCYKGGDIHCGKCGTCVERLEAIHEARKAKPDSLPDLTLYEDAEYWKVAEK